jgi:hypothetical protein
MFNLGRMQGRHPENLIENAANGTGFAWNSSCPGKSAKTRFALLPGHDEKGIIFRRLGARFGGLRSSR